MKQTRRIVWNPPKDGNHFQYWVVGKTSAGDTPQILDDRLAGREYEDADQNIFNLKRGGRCGYTLLTVTCKWASSLVVAHVLKLANETAFNPTQRKFVGTPTNLKEWLVQRTNMAGWTPLHCAAANANPDEALKICRLLLQECSPSVRAGTASKVLCDGIFVAKGSTPAEVAMLFHPTHKELHRLLNSKPSLVERCASLLKDSQINEVVHLLPPTLWHLWHPKACSL
jgi:hypothetical protein